MPLVDYQYRQRAIVKYEGTLDVPTSVIKKGATAVHQYIRDHEHEADDSEYHVDECLEEVEGSMGFDVVKPKRKK